MLYNTPTRVASLIAGMWFVVTLQRVRNWGWFLTCSTFFSKMFFCFWNCQSTLNAQPTCCSERVAVFLSIRSNTCSSSVQFCIWVINDSQLKGRNGNALQESREMPRRRNILFIWRRTGLQNRGFFSFLCTILIWFRKKKSICARSQV